MISTYGLAPARVWLLKHECRITGNFGSGLIWQFGDFRVNHQIKNRQILSSIDALYAMRINRQILNLLIARLGYFTKI